MTPSSVASSVISPSFLPALSRCDDGKSGPFFKRLISLPFVCLCKPTNGHENQYSFLVRAPFDAG